METRDGENSSDGIIASSDDEYDGLLSRAVEHHLHKEESATFRRLPERSSDPDWRRPGYATGYNDMHVYGEHMHGRSARDFPPWNYSRSPPRRSYYSTHQPSYSVLAETFEPAPDYGYRPNIPMRGRSPPSLRREHFPLPQTDYNDPRKSEMFSRETGWLSHAPPHIRPRRTSPTLSRQAHPHSPAGLQHGRPLSPGPPRPRIPHSFRPHPKYHSPDLPTLSTITQPDDRLPSHMVWRVSSETVDRDSHHHFNSQRDRNYLPHSSHSDPRILPPGPLQFPPPRGHDFHPPVSLEHATPQPKIVDRQSKPPPKPISFKIKSIPPAQLSKQNHHPLDPLSQSVPKKTSKSSSPAKWSHDKYEELSDHHTQKPESQDQTPSFPHRNTEEPRRKRSRSGTKNIPCGEDVEKKHEHVDDVLEKSPAQLPQSESESEQSQKSKEQHLAQESGLLSMQTNSADEGLIHTEREDETVYEEEIVVLDEIEEGDDSVLAEDVADSDDDEELLGLRLKALTSALNMENRAKQEESVEEKKKMPSKKRKPKRPLRDNLPKSKSRKTSEVTDIFLKRYHSIAKHHAPDRPRRAINEKPSASQLTLVGEIVKNHQPPPRDTLRIIRSLPDEEKKTAMFLELMKHDQLDHSSATELFREVISAKKKDENQPKSTPVEGKSQKEAEKPSPQQATEHIDGDDYEEMEMDIEDGCSDSGLVPPGTDTIPIALPASPSKSLDAPYSPSRATENISDSSKATSPLKVTLQSPRAPVGTPSQESIWSMLERPVETEEKKKREAAAEKDPDEEAVSTIAVVPLERPRFPSDEADFDEDALLKLRATLLSQLDKPKETNKNLEEFDDGPPGEVVPLPSQFPYQPPTLPLASISAVPVPTATPDRFLMPSTSNIIHLTPITPLVVSVSRSNELTVQPPTLLVPNYPASQLNTPVAVVGDVLPSDLMSGALPTFQPQLASTPALQFGETPPSVGLNNHLRKSRRSPSKKAKQAVNKPGYIDKLHEKNSDSATSNQVESTVGLRHAVDTIVHTPKMAPSTVVKAKPAIAIFNSPSQTVVKTATTLIKTNALAPKYSQKPFSQKPPAGVSKSTTEKPKIRLPRHQPVVINLGDSSDEESILSPSKRRTEAKNPLELHKDMLAAMIRQVREQTTAHQKGKVTVGNVTPEKQKSNKVSLEFLKTSQTSRPLPKIQSPSKVQTQTGAPTKVQETRTARKVSSVENSGEIKASRVQKITPVAVKAVTNQLKNGVLSDTDKRARALANDLKQCRSKFLKLRALIVKDKASFGRVSKIKDAKRAELKVVEDELKEMMYRVAAIKGKKARCEELVHRYVQQEQKINDRLQKRCALKTKLKDQIKRCHRVRAEQRARKNAGARSVATKTSQAQIAKVAGSSSSPSSPAKVRTQEFLDKEKQRLLAIEQKLAVKISEMKKTEAAVVAAKMAPRRASLSKEVQSHLAKYRKTRRSSNPSAHDLSLSKIAISSSMSPVRASSQSRATLVRESASPVKKLLQDSPKMDKDSSPKKPAAEVTPSKTVKIMSANDHAEPEQTQPNSKNAAKVTSNDPAKSKEKQLGSKSSVAEVKKMVKKSMADLKQHLSTALRPFADLPFSSKAWEKHAPDCFRTWKLDVGDIQTSKGEERTTKIYFKFQDYESSLRMFRSYRLNPFLRTKEKLSVKSKTFSHKIDARQIFCRYDLSGTCQDRDCKAQHAKQYELSSAELFFDLVSYCPDLLGKDANLDSNYEDLLKTSQATSDRLCGIASVKNSMSVDDKCVLIASKVNSALGNKPPCTTIFKPRTLRPRRNEDPREVAAAVEDAADAASDHEEDSELPQDATPQHPDLFVKEDERYFLQKDLGTLHRLETEKPHGVQQWLELAYRKLKQRSSSDQNRLELALHTMCLALEENPYNGELWAHYLSLLHHRRGAQSDEDLGEMISQAIELVPLSTHIWNQLLSWKCNVVKREFLYDKLIANLIRNVEDENHSTAFPPKATSRWLLQTVLQRVHLLLHRNSVKDVLPSLEGIVRNFSQQCKWAKSSLRRCMTANDLNSLWIVFINLKHYGSLPSCFQPDPRPSANVARCLGVKVTPGLRVCLHIEPGAKLTNEKYEAMHLDLNDAIGECTPGNEMSDPSCLALLREKLRLEGAQGQWDLVVTTCKKLWETLSRLLSLPDQECDFATRDLELLQTETTSTWADALLRSSGSLEATPVFDTNITEHPSNARLCYEAGSFQLSLEVVDVEAALLYFEACLLSFMKTEKENLSKYELKKMFRYLLRLPMPLNEKAPPLADGKTWDDVDENKAYLWLIYCRILQLDADSYDAIVDSYEKAIDDVKTENDRKEVWLRYLRFRQSTGATVVGSGAQLTKTRQAWLRNFTALVRRCLSMVSPQLPPDEVLAPDENKFCDYTFHNQVAAVYLSCFHTRQQLTSAYNFLTESMPYNVLLVLKACRFFLGFDDHHSVIAVTRKMTSDTACQSKAVWKISMASHFATGRISKATHLSKRAVKAIPHATELWSDYLALLKAYGKPEEFVAEKLRCSSCLQTDAASLIPVGT